MARTALLCQSIHEPTDDLHNDDLSPCKEIDLSCVCKGIQAPKGRNNQCKQYSDNTRIHSLFLEGHFFHLS
jgi:hypothetical protein